MSFGSNVTGQFQLPSLGYDRTRDWCTQAYAALGEEWCEKFFDTLYLNQCEKDKIIGAVKTIINSATTTGKLVEAYPDMMKFIPEEWKKKEETTKKVTTTIKSVGVDVNAFLK